ncbi:NADH-quinone oxidoreductase subunit N [Phytohabitans aurantiacus]|jgi:NADH-quinone oxidoreductase subunit N|uniref:NADH-quinone oxidoreductase subunit N n=1 Tax=Phytohabitans aurantiacus TaxID=3016789 RepID=A0ABQ5QVF6_9ACTN|nr:NADH-quinone oxidoreductase subunit N [Phytohabitans aurantiacus]GLH97857.1 NADH-quinone oxidoreductase subunit N [Phytohabitans aurantiacus]
MTQQVDHVALLPAYLAAGTAVLALLADLFVGRRGVVFASAALGAAATAAGAVIVGRGDDRATFCAGDACSFLSTDRSALVAALFALLTLGVLGISAATRDIPPGEYAFLLACSMTGGVVLGSAGDLITLIVALETLTLPLYVLVGLRRRTVASAEGAVTFFVVSVVATAVTLLGAALLYAVAGRVHFSTLATGDLPDLPLTSVAVVLILAGLAFKVAAVPFHAWAPAAYDGAPVPIAAYLSTASKLGGIIAILYAVVDGLRPALDKSGPALAVLAVLTMTVGNLVALRQTRMVRLLAWSSVAQAGYILAPLGAFMLADGRAELGTAVAATLAYTVFYVVLELAAFGAVVALRPGDDGGTLEEYRGAARQRPWVGAALVLALIGLAGLPPGLAGLFAKVAVVRSLLEGGAGWLAVVVALNAVVGLAYYVRVSALLYAPVIRATPPRVPWPVVTTLAAVTLIVVIVGFAPQLVLDAVNS